MAEEIDVSLSGGVLDITFNNPEGRNALTKEMLTKLSALFAEARDDDDVRCALVHGSETIFSAGLATSEMLSPTEGGQNAALLALHAIESFPKPVIAAVSGPALGYAVALLMRCDIVYAAKNSLFSLPYTALGLAPAFELVPRLLKSAGRHKAAEKIFLSEPISALEAYDMGIINGILEEKDLLPEAISRAGRLANLSPSALSAAKALFSEAETLDRASYLAAERKASHAAYASEDAKEAAAAFKEGRKPNFRR